MGELNLSLTGLNTQESGPYILPRQLNRADPIDGGACVLSPSMYMGGLMYICHLVNYVRKKRPSQFPIPSHLWKMGELVLRSCEWDRRPCTSPGQNSGTGPGGVDTGETP